STVPCSPKTSPSPKKSHTTPQKPSRSVVDHSQRSSYADSRRPLTHSAWAVNALTRAFATVSSGGTQSGAGTLLCSCVVISPRSLPARRLTRPGPGGLLDLARGADEAPQDSSTHRLPRLSTRTGHLSVSRRAGRGAESDRRAPRGCWPG